jgi:hypothetical protein
MQSPPHSRNSTVTMAIKEKRSLLALDFLDEIRITM